VGRGGGEKKRGGRGKRGGGEKTFCIPLGKVSELIEDKPIWVTTKSYVISFHVLSNCPHMLQIGYSTPIWCVIQVICCLIFNNM